MRRLFLFALLLVPRFALAQQTQRPPDCVLPVTGLVAAGNTAQFQNTGTQCTSWTFSYQASGFSSLSIEVDYAGDNNGTPGTFTIWPAGQFYGGGLPMAESYGIASFYGWFPWVRVSLTSVTGTGRVSGVLNGWRGGPGFDATTGTTIIGAGSNGASGAGAGSSLGASSSTAGSISAVESYFKSSVTVVPQQKLLLPCNALRRTFCQ